MGGVLSNGGCVLDILCLLCVLLHNPLEDAKFCVCFKQAVPLVRLRLQLVSCLGWVSVQFSLTLSCMRRPPEAWSELSVLLEPLLYCLASVRVSRSHAQYRRLPVSSSSRSSPLHFPASGPPFPGPLTRRWGFSQSHL